MATQLPPGAAGAAAGVLIYSLICLACGLLLLWLVWVHHERTSYIAMLGFFVTLHTLASIAQQIHTIASWRDIRMTKYNELVANAGSPGVNMSGTLVGADRVLFYIQFYAYNVESLLVLFWAAELANSIFQLRWTKMYRFHASLMAKAIAGLLPLAQLMLLVFAPVPRDSAGYMVLCIGIMVIGLACGAIILFTILARYVHSRITLATFSVRYGRSSGGTNGTSGTKTGTVTTGTRHPSTVTQSIYDKWLLVRFSVGFAALSLFQIVVITYQLRSSATTNAADVPATPDLSAEAARSDFAVFPPGVTAAIVTFLVFGTTRTFREYIWVVFVPRGIRARAEGKKTHKRRGVGGSVSVVHTATGGCTDLEIGNSGGVTMRMDALGGDENLRTDADGKSDEFPIMHPSSSEPREGRR